jgi:DNA-binding Xre family transcriptional regulator
VLPLDTIKKPEWPQLAHTTPPPHGEWRPEVPTDTRCFAFSTARHTVDTLRLRNEARLKREQLAARAGLSADLIQSLEQGRVNNPKLQTLLRLSRALDITIGELVEGVAEIEPEPGRGVGGSSVPITNNSDLLTDLCKIHGFKFPPTRARDARRL